MVAARPKLCNTDTQTHTDTHTQTHRHTQTDTNTDTSADTNTDTHTHRQTQTQTHRHTDTDTHTHTQTHTHTHTNRGVFCCRCNVQIDPSPFQLVQQTSLQKVGAAAKGARALLLAPPQSRESQQCSDAGRILLPPPAPSHTATECGSYLVPFLSSFLLPFFPFLLFLPPMFLLRMPCGRCMCCFRHLE